MSIPSNDLDQPVLDVQLTGTGGSLGLDIRANGSSGPLYVTPFDAVDITIGLDPGPVAGNVADYWVGALTTGGTYWYDYNGTGTWVKSDIPESAGQFPLILLPYISVESSLLEEGLYTYFFILDDNPDGVFDITWLDHVVVISSDTAVSQKDLPSNFEVNLRKKLEKLLKK